jgi:divalent metal cation (Fe/Co/Zn/Cd) transporter
MAQVALPVGAPSTRARDRVRLVIGAKIGYNAAEAVVAIAAGAVASSSALIGFGLDSIVEVLSALAIAWQFAGGTRHVERERVALRVVAVSFFALAAFVGFEAIRTLAGDEVPEHSTAGIVLAIVSLVLMPGLAWYQRRLGHELGSASVIADSKQTLVCASLSAVLLFGLATNSLFGWTWADPVAALVIAAAALREGRNAWRGDACCAPTSMLAPSGESSTCADDHCH